MNVADEIRKLRKQITEIFRVITGFENTAGPHSLLSATHDDTTPDTVVRGDLVTGQAGPVWARLAKGGAGEVLQSDGVDLFWGDLVWGSLDLSISDLVDLATRNHNDLQNIGEDDHHDKLHKLDSTTEHDTADDNANHDVSKWRHGLVPKLPDDDTKCLDGKGNWTNKGGGGGGGSFTKFDYDMFPAAAVAAQSDHFDDASFDAKWTAFNLGGVFSVTEAEHMAKFVYTTDGGGYHWRGYFTALPGGAGDFSIIMKVGIHNLAVNYFGIGISLFEDATNNPTTCKLINWDVERWSTSNRVRVTTLNNYGGWSGSPIDLDVGFANRPYLRIRRNGTTWYFDSSANGLDWFNHGSLAQGSYFTPAEFGICAFNTYAGTMYGWVDFICYIASDSVVPFGALRTIAAP